MKNWNNKVVIITGSSAGIGRETARLFASLGANIVLNGRSREKLDQLKHEFDRNNWQCISVCGDIGNEEFCSQLIQATLAKWRRIDVLVNNAGISMRGRFEDLSNEVDWKVWDVNYFGAACLTRIAYPYLQEAGGSVIFVSSIAAFRGLPVMSSYCSSKMAITALAEALYVEAKSTGVHVGVVYPGYTENDEDKTILNTSGSPVKLINLDQYSKHDQRYIAGLILKNISKRKFKTVSSFMGRLHHIANFFIPRIMDLLLLRISGKMSRMTGESPGKIAQHLNRTAEHR